MNGPGDQTSFREKSFPKAYLCKNKLNSVAMRFSIIIFLTAGLLGGCTMLMAPDPQPVGEKGLKSIPSELTGLYREVGSDETLYVAPAFFRYGHWKRYVNQSLSSDFQIKRIPTGYVVNLRDDATQPWAIYPVEVRPRDSLLIVYALPVPQNPQQERKLSQIVSKVIITKASATPPASTPLSKAAGSEHTAGARTRWLITASPEEFTTLMESWPLDTIGVFRRLPQK